MPSDGSNRGYNLHFSAVQNFLRESVESKTSIEMQQKNFLAKNAEIFFSLLVDLNEFFSLDEVCWTVEIFCAVRRQWRCCCRCGRHRRRRHRRCRRRCRHHRRHRHQHRRCRHRDSVATKFSEKRMVTHV